MNRGGAVRGQTFRKMARPVRVGGQILQGGQGPRELRKDCGVRGKSHVGFSGLYGRSIQIVVG